MDDLRAKVEKIRTTQDWYDVEATFILLLNGILKRAGYSFEFHLYHSWRITTMQDDQIVDLWLKMRDVTGLAQTITYFEVRRKDESGKFRPGKAKAHRTQMLELKQKASKLYDLLVIGSLRY